MKGGVEIMAGGCMCGAVRFEISAPPEFSIICACRQCQKITGAGHAPAFSVPADAVRIDGKLRFHSQKADSGNTVSNGFCPKCGNPILKKTSGFPDRLYFHVAALDDPSGFKPDFVVCEESAQPWDNIKI